MLKTAYRTCPVDQNNARAESLGNRSSSTCIGRPKNCRSSQITETAYASDGRSPTYYLCVCWRLHITVLFAKLHVRMFHLSVCKLHHQWDRTIGLICLKSLCEKKLAVMCDFFRLTHVHSHTNTDRQTDRHMQRDCTQVTCTHGCVTARFKRFSNCRLTELQLAGRCWPVRASGHYKPTATFSASLYSTHQANGGKEINMHMLDTMHTEPN